MEKERMHKSMKHENYVETGGRKGEGRGEGRGERTRMISLCVLCSGKHRQPPYLRLARGVDCQQSCDSQAVNCWNVCFSPQGILAPVWPFFPHLRSLKCVNISENSISLQEGVVEGGHGWATLQKRGWVWGGEKKAGGQSHLSAGGGVSPPLPSPTLPAATPPHPLRHGVGSTE